MELLDELAEEADGPTRAVAGTVLANVEDYRQQAIETLTAGAEGEDQEWSVANASMPMTRACRLTCSFLQCCASRPALPLHGQDRPGQADL